MFRRSFAVSAVLTLTASAALPMLIATPASAAIGIQSEVTVFASDTDGDGDYSLYRAVAGQAPTTVVAESERTDVEMVTSSQDGSRYAYVQDTYDADSNITGESIVVRDAGGAVVRTVDAHVPEHDTATTDTASADVHPALSPDGTEMVWTQFNATFSGTTDKESISLHRVNLSTGATTVLTGGGDRLAWIYLNQTTLLAIDGAALATLPITGGTAKPVSGAVNANDDGEFVLSPDGSTLAWTHISSTTNDVQVADIDTGTVTVSSTGIATIGAGTSIATGLNDHAATWSYDGSTIRFIHNDGNNDGDGDGDGDVWSVPSNGSAAPTQTSTPGDELAVADVVVDDTAPDPATQGPAVLAGTNAKVTWTLPTTATDLSGVSITRTGGSGSKTVLVAAPATSYIDTGLTLGTTYTYAISAVDHSGNLAAASTRQLTAIKPALTFTDPISTASTRAAFAIGLPNVGTYTVAYRTNGTGPLTTWVSNASGASRVFTPARAGSSYGFLITVSDAFGNSSAPTGGGYGVVPYDQTRASFGGTSVTQAAGDRYLGTVRVLQKSDAYARMVVNGNRVQIIGERCVSCGVMDVYLDGTRVAGIDTHATRRAARQVLYTRSISVGKNHTILIKARGTAGHPNIAIDGFGVRH